MDDLISSLGNFSISNNINTLQDDISDIVNKMGNLSASGGCEWETLQDNYSKLKYISHLIYHNISITQNDKFMDSLTKFNYLILDPINQRYLQEINFFSEEPDVNYDCSEIEYLLEHSLNVSEPLYKINVVLSAYKLLVQIVELYTNRKMSTEILDQTFLTDFNY
jgi:hypothetical protein